MELSYLLPALIHTTAGRIPLELTLLPQTLLGGATTAATLVHAAESTTYNFPRCTQAEVSGRMVRLVQAAATAARELWAGV